MQAPPYVNLSSEVVRTIPNPPASPQSKKTAFHTQCFGMTASPWFIFFDAHRSSNHTLHIIGQKALALYPNHPDGFMLRYG
jgi:hypothetical protein